jgi:GTP-binding protein Era
MKSGFVNIIGKPNAGKSTLLNAVVGEKLAIVSSKVQTTRHRIRAFLNGPDYQIVFSDTPGIIEPQYKLHEKMMLAVKSSMQDADVSLFIADVRDDLEQLDALFSSIKIHVPCILVLNKSDLTNKKRIEEAIAFFSAKKYGKKIVVISAAKKENIDGLLEQIVDKLPDGEPFFDVDDLTDMPTKFFAGEIVREKIFQLFEEEIPYQTAVLVQRFEEKQTLIKIVVDIIVQRESQKAILLGGSGSMIKKLGTLARIDLEAFLGSKVFLELFVKVRSNWRNDDLYLKEYGYN